MPNLILSTIEYTFTHTLSQSQVLKVLDVIGIDYKSSQLSSNISINTFICTCYIFLWYPHLRSLAAITKLKYCEFFLKHASILSSEGAGRKEIAESNKNPPLLSMADSIVTYGAHVICMCSIRKCPELACNQATCLPPLVALSPQFVWLSAIQQWYRWHLQAEDSDGTSRKEKWWWLQVIFHLNLHISVSNPSNSLVISHPASHIILYWVWK